MTTHKVGMRYLGGWGGDFETELSSSALSSGAIALTEILKKLKKRSLKDREKIYKKWDKNYEIISQELIPEEDQEQFKKDDRYMKKIKRQLGL